MQVFFIVLIIIIAGFRYETGVDWIGYQNYFDRTPPLDQALKFDDFKRIFLTLDLGYSLLNSIIKMLGGGIQTIFILVSIISNVFLLKNLRYYTKYVITGLLIYFSFYFFIYDMSGLRQGLAIQFVFFSFKFIEKRNLKNYVFFIILAGSIHWTGYLLLPMYFFLHKDFSKYYYYVIIFCLIIFTFKIEIVDKLVPDLNNFLRGSDLLLDKVTTYTTNETFSEGRSWDIYSFFHFIRMFFILIILKRMKLKSKVLIVYFNLLVLEFICYFGLYELSEVSERLRFYFTLSQLILIPYILFNCKTYYLKDIYYIFTIIITFFNCSPYILQFPSTVAYHPYQNYIIYKIFEIKSTGVERLNKHIDTH